MRGELVAREYARVFSRVAPAEAAGLQAFFRELGRAAAADVDFRNFLNHPAITTAEKLSALKALSRQPLGEVAGRVLADILKRRITYLFFAIADEMEALADKARNIHTVSVTSATPLADGLQKALKDKLAAYTRGEVKARFSVDGRLMSGLLIKIGDTIIDNTMKTDLERIRRELMAASST